MTATYTTLDAAQTAYLESANYAVDSSLAQAKKHAVACRCLLLLLPQAAAQGGASTTWRPDLIEKSLAAAEAFVAAAGNAGAVRHLSAADGEDWV